MDVADPNAIPEPPAYSSPTPSPRNFKKLEDDHFKEVRSITNES